MAERLGSHLHPTMFSAMTTEAQQVALGHFGHHGGQWVIEIGPNVERLRSWVPMVPLQFVDRPAMLTRPTGHELPIPSTTAFIESSHRRLVSLPILWASVRWDVVGRALGADALAAIEVVNR